jgi:hypothetical protein
MRFAVDPAGEAADDDEPGGGQLAAEHPGDLPAVRGARAGADDPDRSAREELDLGSTSYEQACRRVVDRTQERRKGGVRTGVPSNPGLSEHSEITGFVERPFEGDERAIARLTDEVRAALGRKGCERELAHVGPSSVGER